jgi:hypothetical protein
LSLLAAAAVVARLLLVVAAQVALEQAPDYPSRRERTTP